MDQRTATAEQWKAVPGYEGSYEVSDQGRLRSIDRTIIDKHGRQVRIRGRILKSVINKSHGRREVSLWTRGVGRTACIYPLVLRAFVGPPPKGTEACHNDGNCLNDRLDNLRWDTRSANLHDAVRHGTHWAAAKAQCKHGHLLVEPNLVPSVARRGLRGCLACERGRSKVRKSRYPIDFQAAADAKYAEIMKE